MELTSKLSIPNDLLPVEVRDFANEGLVFSDRATEDLAIEFANRFALELPELVNERAIELWCGVLAAGVEWMGDKILPTLRSDLFAWNSPLSLVDEYKADSSSSSNAGREGSDGMS